MDQSAQQIEHITEVPLENSQGCMQLGEVQGTEREEEMSRIGVPTPSTPSWKSTLFFWRRSKRNPQICTHTPAPHQQPCHLLEPPHPHSSARISPRSVKKPHSGPLYRATYYSGRCADKENSCFSSWFSSCPCNKEDNIVYASHVKIHHGPSTGSNSTLMIPFSYTDHSLPPPLFDKHSPIPYVQLRRHDTPSCASRPRLPLYIVS